jgi:hypothetical protein
MKDNVERTAGIHGGGTRDATFGSGSRQLASRWCQRFTQKIAKQQPSRSFGSPVGTD